MTRNVPARETIALTDGRALSYLEFGDPDGVPCLFTMGSPCTALGALGYAAAAERNGVRLISIDKPGYGLSTRDPNRSLLRYGHDVVELADALDLDAVAVCGHSGGGPHALAAAYALGTRVTVLSLLCSYGPAFEPWARDDLNATMRMTAWFAMRAPTFMAVPVALLRFMVGNPKRVKRMTRLMGKQLSLAEREAALSPKAELICEGIAEAFRHGSAAVCDEFRAIGQEWGFRLQDVTADTDMWHGTSDRSCPIGMARGMAARLPHVTLHELPDLGHVFFGAELDEAMRTVRTKAGCLPA